MGLYNEFWHRFVLKPSWLTCGEEVLIFLRNAGGVLHVVWSVCKSLIYGITGKDCKVLENAGLVVLLQCTGTLVLVALEL